MSYLRAYPKPAKKEKVVRTKKAPIESNPVEWMEQRALCQWMDLKDICYQGSLIGAFLHPATFNRSKAMGVQSGHPDIMIYDRPPNQNKFVGVAIEMKRKNGGVVSELQEHWQLALSERGWKVKICYGADEAISFLQVLGF